MVASTSRMVTEIGLSEMDAMVGLGTNAVRVVASTFCDAAWISSCFQERSWSVLRLFSNGVDTIRASRLKHW